MPGASIVKRGFLCSLDGQARILLNNSLTYNNLRGQNLLEKFLERGLNCPLGHPDAQKQIDLKRYRFGGRALQVNS
jgi:hypothetical protein